MQGQDTSKHITFRASPALASALEHAAKTGGSSVSEVIREAVEERLRTGRVDPFARLARAARGDLQAQRDLVREAAIQAADESQDSESRQRILLEGIVFARLAAAQGDTSDQQIVTGLLCRLIDLGGGEVYADDVAEVIARLSLAADQGCEFSADALNHFTKEYPGELAAEAQEIIKRMTAGGVA